MEDRVNTLWKRQRINPLEFINSAWPVRSEYVKILFDPTINKKTGRWFRIKQQTTDGTVYFTQNMIEELLLPIVNGNSFCLKDMTTEEFNTTVKGITYTLGYINLVTTFGHTFNKFPAQRERVRMYIKAEYDFK